MGINECTVKGMPEGTSKDALLELFKAAGAVGARILSEKPWTGLVTFASQDALFASLRSTYKNEDGAELECDLPWLSKDPRAVPELLRARSCLRTLGIEKILT